MTTTGPYGSREHAGIDENSPYVERIMLSLEFFKALLEASLSPSGRATA
jgi:hypothetical protein